MRAPSAFLIIALLVGVVSLSIPLLTSVNAKDNSQLPPLPDDDPSLSQELAKKPRPQLRKAPMLTLSLPRKPASPRLSSRKPALTRPSPQLHPKPPLRPPLKPPVPSSHPPPGSDPMGSEGNSSGPPQGENGDSSGSGPLDDGDSPGPQEGHGNCSGHPQEIQGHGHSDSSGHPQEGQGQGHGDSAGLPHDQGEHGDSSGPLPEDHGNSSGPPHGGNVAGHPQEDHGDSSGPPPQDHAVSTSNASPVDEDEP